MRTSRRAELLTPCCVPAPVTCASACLAVWCCGSLPHSRVQHLPYPAEHTRESLLRLKPRRRNTPMTDIVNSAPGVPPSILLASHVTYFREVRKWWQTQRSHRLARFKDRLALLDLQVFPTPEERPQEVIQQMAPPPTGESTSAVSSAAVSSPGPPTPQHSAPSKSDVMLAAAAEHVARHAGLGSTLDPTPMESPGRYAGAPGTAAERTHPPRAPDIAALPVETYDGAGGGT